MCFCGNHRKKENAFRLTDGETEGNNGDKTRKTGHANLYVGIGIHIAKFRCATVIKNYGFELQP